MKTMKKVFAMLMVFCMVLGLGVTTFAATANHTLTLTGTMSGHHYDAYQVFAGDIASIASGKVLSNVTWGSGIDAEKEDELLAELNSAINVWGITKSFTSAAEVAEALASIQNDSAQLDAFSHIVGKYLSNIYVSSTGGTENTGTADAPVYTYTISGLDDGYYLVEEHLAGHQHVDGDAHTKYMLELMGDLTAAIKADAPDIVKELKQGTNWESANNAGIGDKVEFRIQSDVPTMDGYEKYYFVVNDTLSKGLTFNNDVAITIGSGDNVVTLSQCTHTGENATHTNCYTVTQTAIDDDQGGGTKIEIIFKNFVQYKPQKEQVITITYSATLNENAVIGTTGNPNTVNLTYSNDPNVTDDGDEENPDKPGPGSPTGTTPNRTTQTYATGIQLTKVDGADAVHKLTGAKFQISGKASKPVMINEEMFQGAEDGTYYRLKDGTYTETAPTINPGQPDDNSASYESTTQKYTKVTTITQNNVEEDFVTEGWVDKNGVITFKSLGAGDYVITELVAPDGYNLLTQPLNVKVTWTAPTVGATDCTWSGTYKLGATGTAENITFDSNTGLLALNVENKAGTGLPSTGGIGTTIFYVVGSILMIGATVLLITKKKLSSGRE